MSKARTPEIMADAAYVILTKPSREFTGNFCIDDETLRAAGVKDLSKYACVPGTPDSGLLPDFFVSRHGDGHSGAAHWRRTETTDLLSWRPHGVVARPWSL